MHVLISGAGVAGPAMAFFLAKTGARVTIFEKAHELLPYGQNIDVNGSALILVKKMLLMDQLRKYNTTEKGSQFISPKGKTFAPFPVREDSTASLTAEFEILRGDLSLIFYEATKHLANVTYTFGTTIKNVVSNDDDIVKVETSNGDVQEYDLLVAADGQMVEGAETVLPTREHNCGGQKYDCGLLHNTTVTRRQRLVEYLRSSRIEDCYHQTRPARHDQSDVHKLSAK
jgi:flavin-dependent dehydrogenase